MSVLADVAEAVKIEVNANDFGRPFEAERTHGFKRLTVQQLGTAMAVHVVPWSDEIRLKTRGSRSHEITVFIFFQNKMSIAEQERQTSDIDKEEIDACDDVAEAVAVHFMPRQATDAAEATTGRLPTYTNAAWVSSKRTPYANESFAMTRIWMSQVELVFDVPV